MLGAKKKSPPFIVTNPLTSSGQVTPDARVVPRLRVTLPAGQ